MPVDSNARTSKSTAGEQSRQLGRTTALYGVYIGFVKGVADIQRNGRLQVWIPEFGAPSFDEQSWITVNYCSPFAGSTSVNTISKTDFQNFDTTQTSYGFWMVPPDIDNQVLVMFINGDASKGIWIGSLYDQFMNNMVPAMAASVKNWQYPGKEIPIAEYNKNNTSITQPDRAIKPYEKTKFKGLGNQGLITDQGRGVTTTSARRESPSNVFGIITPGPVIDSTAAPKDIRRKGGSSFIMDDGPGTEYVQLTTKSGAQIRLDETNGFVYLINRDGTAWVEMDQNGNVSIFGAKNISMRAQQDINFRADRNINIEAGQNIFIKAAKDTINSTTSFTYDVNNVPKPVTNLPYYKYVGEGSGLGGNIVVQALNNMHTTITQDQFTTVKRDANLIVTRDYFVTVQRNNIVLVSNNYALTTTSGKQDFKSGSNILFDAAAEYDLKAGSNILVSAGVGINNTAATIKNQSAFFDITGSSRISGTVEINQQLKVSAGSFLGAPVALGGLVTTTSPIAPTAANAAAAATPGTIAEVKQLTQKINILATWADPESKFKRNSEGVQTTVSTFPTYEPCPEHETFTFASIAGYKPTETEGAKTYQGSAGPGNPNTVSPKPNADPGANNKDIPTTPANESAVSKDFNMPAYECQLKIHEGVKYVSYNDSVGLPTGGIGHLLRTNEIPQFPIPTPISVSQVSTWFQIDAPISISGAQRLLGIDVWGNLSDVRKRACADLCYNMGEARLARFVRFLAAMRAGNYDLAGQSLRESKWFTQVGTRGPKIIAMIVQNVDPNGCDRRTQV